MSENDKAEAQSEVEPEAIKEEVKEAEPTILCNGKQCTKKDIEDLMKEHEQKNKPKKPYKNRCCDSGCPTCYYDMVEKY